MHVGCRWLALGAFLTCLSLCFAADKDEKKEEPIKLTKDEQTLVDLTNRERKKEGLNELTVNAVLNKAAVVYCGVMLKEPEKARKLILKKDPAAHEIDGTNVGERLDKLAYKWADCGENLFFAGLKLDMAVIHKGWMDSKDHRDNILDKAFKEIGIAIAKHPTRKNEWYITQVFGTLKKD